jgi:hypothetical protein
VPRESVSPRGVATSRCAGQQVAQRVNFCLRISFRISFVSSQEKKSKSEHLRARRRLVTNHKARAKINRNGRRKEYPDQPRNKIQRDPDACMNSGRRSYTPHSQPPTKSKSEINSLFSLSPRHGRDEVEPMVAGRHKQGLHARVSSA